MTTRKTAALLVATAVALAGPATAASAQAPEPPSPAPSPPPTAGPSPDGQGDQGPEPGAPQPTTAGEDPGGGGALVEDEPGLPEGYEFDGAFTSVWLESSARGITPDGTTTLPVVEIPDLIDTDAYVWDNWPMRTPTGEVAVVDGYVVLVALTAPREGNIPGERHGLAQWSYYFTRGEEWIEGGPVFPEGTALGERQWAGSTVYDPATGRATMYYSALGGNLPDDARYDDADQFEDPAAESRQEIAATSAQVVTGDGVRFSDFAPHEIILTADGEYYVTAEMSRRGNGPYVFRDPFWFLDPRTGREYLLFAASSALYEGSHAAVVGAAERLSDGTWRTLPALLNATGTNSQLERPHIVVQDGRYYLFVTTHGFSFAEDIEAPAGLYGFVADSASVRGHYLPLNDNGLVLANPAEAPQELYSFLVLPGGNVLNYVNYVNLGDVSLSEIGEQSRQWQREHFGGTPGPLFDIRIVGQHTMLESQS
ncbi:glycoside hydrolase family 68 protein [Geodermatophilus sp. SYSU D00758]